MFGKNRKLVPTKWSITATDQIISSELMTEILDFDVIDQFQIFHFDNLGNLFFDLGDLIPLQGLVIFDSPIDELKFR